MTLPDISRRGALAGLSAAAASAAIPSAIAAPRLDTKILVLWEWQSRIARFMASYLWLKGFKAIYGDSVTGFRVTIAEQRPDLLIVNSERWPQLVAYARRYNPNMRFWWYNTTVPLCGHPGELPQPFTLRQVYEKTVEIAALPPRTHRLR